MAKIMFDTPPKLNMEPENDGFQEELTFRFGDFSL